MQTDSREAQDKHLLAIGRELQRLYRAPMLLVELDEPIQRGWIRRYVIADKIGAHKDKPMLAEILKVIGTTRWHRSPEFKKWRRKQRRFVDIEQPLAKISASRWERRMFPKEWKRYFRLEMVRHQRLYHLTYVFAHAGLFELRVEPNVVTELWIRNPEVEARIAALKRWMIHRDLEPRLHRLRDDSLWYKFRDDSRPRALERLAEREIFQALRNFPEVDLNSFHWAWLLISFQTACFRSRSPRQRQLA